ncbi:O-phosphoseryl-tRNA(Sec) selenium transferase [Tetrabaena socialis]|uniref:O-phosphoseryl-tRNA(Sec) selenium transferase n=1 Tax=Tetrabaena socialis TaxID=47790 RepID=A0A2J8A8R9_9CHLO|nr:O-phosphoseryl-tRNA(Sec) selenium transferase [Tetrabaena socialis]|eukprot:PNH08917.1 O-phosphoseryl-tRNA(Sec) selenium transferase [Tetrabaena socialis]
MAQAQPPGAHPCRILCLHGSRQDGELFSQRLARGLTRKLAGVAVRLARPLGSNDPRRHALAAHLDAAAAEAVVEAAREWVDAHLPADIGERRETAHHPTSAATPIAATPANANAASHAHHHHHLHLHATTTAAAAASTAAAPAPAGAGGAAAATARGGALTPVAAAAAVAAAATGPGVVNLGWGATALGVATATGATGRDPWWVREEADPALIAAAATEAAASAPWRTGRAEAVALAEADAAAAAALQVWRGLTGVGPVTVLPLATGMTLSLVLLALRPQRPPGADVVVWSCIDQKTCLKAITAAGLRPHVVELRRSGVYGSTGAALALACAVAMRPPRPVFPVAELEGLAALQARGAASGAGGLLGSGLDAKARAAEGGSPGVLRDCLLLKPGSTVVDLFEVLKRPPYQLLEGDFVRAECSAMTSPEGAAASAAAAAAAAAGSGGSGLPAPPPQQSWRVLKKDEVLDWGSCVARVMTNRRSHWQAVKR